MWCGYPIAFCLVPMPQAHHLRLTEMSYSDGDSLVASASSTMLLSLFTVQPGISDPELH